MDTVTLFIYLAATAIILQFVILLFLFIAVWNLKGRMESMSTELEKRILPILDQTNAMLADTGPKLSTILDNAAVVTTSARNQMDRLDATLNDTLDRVRLQVIRTDELVSRTIDKVEETTDLVQRTIVTPVRRISGIAAGLGAGFGAFFGRRRRSQGDGQDDELFI